MYVLSTPENVGGYTDRGPPVSQPTNYALHGQPARGWFIYEILATVFHTPRSISKATRA